MINRLGFREGVLDFHYRGDHGDESKELTDPLHSRSSKNVSIQIHMNAMIPSEAQMLGFSNLVLLFQGCCHVEGHDWVILSTRLRARFPDRGAISEGAKSYSKTRECPLELSKRESTVC
jgi:hypothetical protein